MEVKLKSYLDIERALAFLLEVEVDEGDTATAEEIEEMKDLLSSASAAKVDSLVFAIRSAEKQIEFLNESAKIISAKADRLAKAVESMKSRRIAAMNALDISVAKGNIHQVSVHNSVKVETVDDEVDPAYLIEKTTYRPDKVAIKHALLKGCEIAGARLVTSQHLRIR